MMGSWILHISMFFKYLGKYQLQVCSHILQGTFSLSSLSFLSLSSESCLVPQATLDLLSSSNPPASGILGLQQALLLLTILSVFVHTFVAPPPNRVQLFCFLFCCLCLWNHIQNPPKLMSWSCCLMFSPESFIVSWRLSCRVLCHLDTS